MSKKFPIISVVGASGAGTSTVKDTFEKIFVREKVTAASIEGDAFHRFNRKEMRAELEKRYSQVDQTFSHFSYDANLLEELELVLQRHGLMSMTKKKRKFMGLIQVNLLTGEIFLRNRIFYFMRDYMERQNLKI